MLHLHKKTVVIVMLVTGIAVASLAQEKKKTPLPRPKNLKVLPKNITNDSLINLMHIWESSLGVNCGFCHVKVEGEGRHMDFASDANRKKDIARRMHTMTMDINKRNFAKWNAAKEGRPAAVTCYTCHHGHEEPDVFTPQSEEEHEGGGRRGRGDREDHK